MPSTITRTVKRLGGSGEGADGPVWALHVAFSPDVNAAGSALELSNERTVIGRATATVAGAWALADGGMSRNHVAFLLTEGGVEVRDLDSRNGTWIDGVRVSRAQLVDGSVVRAGETVFVVERANRSARFGPEDITELPGRSAWSNRTRDQLRKCAPTLEPVLVRGETGVGKDFAAKALHRLSGRTGRLVALNTAAVPGPLFESEFFGHVAGAFSGAQTARKGRISEADGGTLLLDEIGDLPLALQPKLLRALEDGAIRPVGGTRDRAIDVRFVAATNREIDERIAAGAFRQDLAARLRSVEIEFELLRRRRADILELADAVVPHQRPWRATIDADAAEALLVYPWPDNLRGLARVLRALPTDSVRFADLPARISAHLKAVAAGAPSPVAAAQTTRSPPSRDELLAALREHSGNVGAVARQFGRDRKQVYRWIRKHGIDEDALAKIRS